jgi:hypothetical protein
VTIDEQNQMRSSLEDSLEILRKLGQHTDSVTSVIRMIELALVDDGQLRFLLGMFARTGQLKGIVQ